MLKQKFLKTTGGDGMTKLYLIRHAEAEGNLYRRIHGQYNSLITDNGYRQKADKIVESLATDAYLARRGTNGNFILMHSVGSIPHGNEIDVPLSYADYYYLEALTRRALK